MDNDSEVNAPLDILAEFCTQKNEENGTNFSFITTKLQPNTEVQILSQYPRQWCKINNFETRKNEHSQCFSKYGDAIFLRDPETKKLFHVDPAKLTRIIVNESRRQKVRTVYYPKT